MILISKIRMVTVPYFQYIHWELASTQLLHDNRRSSLLPLPHWTLSSRLLDNRIPWIYCFIDVVALPYTSTGFEFSALTFWHKPWYFYMSIYFSTSIIFSLSKTNFCVKNWINRFYLYYFEQGTVTLKLRKFFPLICWSKYSNFPRLKAVLTNFVAVGKPPFYTTT